MFQIFWINSILNSAVQHAANLSNSQMLQISIRPIPYTPTCRAINQKICLFKNHYGNSTTCYNSNN